MFIERIETEPLHEWYLNLAKYPDRYSRAVDWRTALQSQGTLLGSVR